MSTPNPLLNEVRDTAKWLDEIAAALKLLSEDGRRHARLKEAARQLVQKMAGRAVLLRAVADQHEPPKGGVA